MDLTRERVLAYRVARHGLHRDTARVTDLAVLDLGVQDGGAPRAALAARLPDGADLDDPALVVVWAFRGAPHLLRRADLPELAGSLWPRSDADAIARLGGSGTKFKKAGIPGLTVFAGGARALRDVVDREKPRGQVSAEVTAALPPEYSYDCRVCAATHVYGSLFQLVGLFAGVEVRAQTRPTTLRPVADRCPVPAESTGAGPLVEAYLRLHGPSTLAHAAGFLDTTQAQVKPVWPEGLVEVRVDGKPCYLAEEDVPALLGAPPADLVRLLPPHDPLLQLRDRDLLVPDEARRKRVWRMIGNPGALLVGGEVAGTWRTKTAGRALAVTVEPFARLASAARKAVEDEAQRVAVARGHTEARVTITA
ncbi:DNA glycosylase AlkZ-like family protein [Actinokineospora iranica]|uniref:Winged helix DNA-binding domain-containing protein n=1 Tax=Actinokineospora iranica TaxID=1271860 RepID=A0A1G6IQ65_9PSEU|nr:crosslink repair DNA glycosylase YcaQ family protein [Actinokineospora iranica]SDC08702.1 Winged helix DNA-binding domain-containing protein [Actinokineospora iranica]